MDTKSQLDVKRLGSNIVSFDLKFEGANTQLATGFFDHLEHPAPQASRSIFISDKQLCDRGLPPVELQVVSKGQDGVAHGFVRITNDPDSTQ